MSDQPPDPRRTALLARARAAKGFMPDDEGLALYQAAVRAGRAATGAATLCRRRAGLS